MPRDPAFAEMMAALGDGVDAVATEVFRRYVTRLLALADTLLARALRQKVDADDVVQSLFRSFFQRCRAGAVRATDWDQLWALLVVMTVRKCRNQASRHQVARRDCRLEVSLEAVEAPWWQPLDRDPTPLEAAALAETVEQLHDSFDPRDQPIVTLYVQGRSVAEIRDRVQRSERTIRRVCQRVRQRLERLLEQEPPPPVA